MNTPRQQVESLRAAIEELDQKIDQRKVELVEMQIGMMDGEVDDEELIGLYGMRKKFQVDLDRLLREESKR